MFVTRIFKIRYEVIKSFRTHIVMICVHTLIWNGVAWNRTFLIQIWTDINYICRWKIIAKQLLFISRIPKPCAIPQLVSAPLIPPWFILASLPKNAYVFFLLAFFFLFLFIFIFYEYLRYHVISNFWYDNI